ncbi:MAG: HNH endonuclease signature motif containing protein, partial [Spirochaetaceae bacterium]|nr:HNH endonuclease signature motif containing protein [Spirochaetaceae bacterium]
SPAIRPGRAHDDGRGAAGPQFDAGERGASRAPVRGHDRFTSSAAKRLAYAAGQGAVERSPALARHLAALNGCGASPGSRSRYIPVAVRREVWRRDQGCCSYVDPHSGRRCGSRYRLEIDHVVPFALGGATELWNLRIRCRAHHRLRHAPRHAHPASGPNENPGAP